MQIIDDLEVNKRGPYGGGVGVVDPNPNSCPNRVRSRFREAKSEENRDKRREVLRWVVLCT